MNINNNNNIREKAVNICVKNVRKNHSKNRSIMYVIIKKHMYFI